MTLLCSVMAWAQNPTTAAELQDAVDAATDGVSTTITLGATIEAGALNTQVLNIPAEKVIVLDMDGKTISASLGVNNACVISNAGNLTIQGGGTITNTRNNIQGTPVILNNAGASLNLVNCNIVAVAGIGIENEGTLVVEENVVVRSETDLSDGYTKQSSAIYSHENTADVTINGGTFSNNDTYSPILYQEYGSQMIINGGIFNSPNNVRFYLFTNNVNVTKLEIKGGTFNYDPSEYVHQGYLAMYNDNTSKWEVEKILDPAQYTVNSEAELAAAIAGVTLLQAAEITIGSDFAIEGTVTLPHGSEVIIPAGKTLTVRGNGLFLNNGIVTNAGTIAISGQGFFSNPSEVTYEGAGVMTMEGYTEQIDGNTITYKISCPMHLQYLAYLVMDNKADDKTWNITLENDITIPEGVNFKRIETIINNSTFDGKNHTIDNLKMYTQSATCVLVYTFHGTFKNVTINAISQSESYSGVLAYNLRAGSTVENVTINGSVSGSGASAFVCNAQHTGMLDAELDHIWFVNCTNNANITSTGYFAGCFFSTISGAKGTFGFYNCVNNGNITNNRNGGGYAGIISAYGNGSGTANIDVIAFTNTGSVTGAINTAKWKVNGVNYLGWSSKTYAETYFDATQYTAVWNGTKYVPQPNSTNIDNDGITTTIDWAENTTWTNDDGTTHNIVPSAGDDVTVNNTNEQGVVVTTENAVAKSVTVNTKLTVEEGGKLTIGDGGLTIGDGASVTVEKGATLIIGKNGVTNNGGTLVIEATQADGAGVVLVDTAATTNNHPTATVKLIPDAHHVGGDNYLYRYIGIPLYLGSADFNRSANLDIYHGGDKDPLDVDTYLKSWNPATGWQNIGDWSDLVPFKGYAISNSSEDNLTYIFKGQLMGNADGAMTFSHGFNMFANSYTAPIDIYSLIEGMDGDNVDLTIYMFVDNEVKSVNMGSFGAYEDDPAFTKIPSMQAFFVHVSNNAATAEEIKYAQSVFTPTPEANGALYAPARQATPDFNRVRINVADENGATDAVYMIESASFTNEFDNGYDAVKYMNNGLNLFATTAHGRQASNYTNSIEGSFIGVQGNGTYTMSFDKLAGEEYQIRDLQNGVVIAMTEDNTYTFTANGAEQARFVVEKIAKMPTAINNAADAKMFVSNNTLYVSANDADIQIFAANGQLVLAEKAQATVDLSGLNAGVYTVRVANQTLKFVK